MSIGAMLLGVCHPQKLEWMPLVISAIDGSRVFNFDKKVLAIDEFKGWTFPMEKKVEFEKSGWDVIIDRHMSRPKSMIHSLDLLDQDIVFYHEDDVIPELPDRSEIEDMFNLSHGDRDCGMVSMTLGGTTGWFSGFPNTLGDLAYVKDNILIESSDRIYFKRMEEYKEKHFFEFPGLFIRRDLLEQCLSYSMTHCHNMQIEQALTKAWFDLGLDTRYFKVSVAKKNLIEQIEKNPREIFNNCRFLKNLDPNQGCSAFYGKHTV